MPLFDNITKSPNIAIRAFVQMIKAM